MDSVYQRLKDRTRQIAAKHPSPDFYRRYVMENGYALSHIATSPPLLSIRKLVAGQLGENLGHGFEHAEKVAIDAGALILIEGRAAGYSRFFMNRLLFLVQAAALLHDICRIEENHARKGAEKAREHLAGYPFTDVEVEQICRAIYNHEAFKETLPLPEPAGRLISDCLYDADKFRWGTDNFSHTLWDMLAFSKVPVADFVARFPDGMDTLKKIRGTFRTRTGKRFGPRFIDIGLAIGGELFEAMKTDFRLVP
jgi:hypothetical protein